MIRSKLKDAARALRDRLLPSGAPAADAWSPPPPARDRTPASASAVSTGIPLMPGRGDMPGPNHKEDVSRTWVAAQVLSGVPPFLLDCRPTMDGSTRRIPGAVNLTLEGLQGSTASLPASSEPIVVYDDDGDGPSGDVARWLRARGWSGARRLAGGLTGWQDAGEPTEPGEPLPHAPR